MLNAGDMLDMNTVRAIRAENNTDEIIQVLAAEFEKQYNIALYTTDGILRVGINDPLYKDFMQKHSGSLNPQEKKSINQNLLIRHELKKHYIRAGISLPIVQQ